MRILLAFLILACAVPAVAEEIPKPLWEIGLAGGIFTIPQYVGSDQRYTLPLGLPYLIYRGEILRADRDGVRGRLFEADGLSLDLSFSFGLPVRNSNDARRGMPALLFYQVIGNEHLKCLSPRPSALQTWLRSGTQATAGRSGWTHS